MCRFVSPALTRASGPGRAVVDRPAHGLGHLSDRLAPGAAAGGPNALQTLRRVGRLEQELGHGSPPRLGWTNPPTRPCPKQGDRLVDPGRRYSTSLSAKN